MDLIFFFNELALKNRAMNMHLNPIPILYFSKGGGRGTPPPRLYIDLDPPAFIGLNPEKGLTFSILQSQKSKSEMHVDCQT